MDTQSYTPEIQRLIATNILLSNGGSIYLAPGTMSFPVIDEDKNVREKDVTAIFYGMGTSPKDICLYFTKGFAPVTEEDDKRKVWTFILSNYKNPDADILPEKELLEERVRLRSYNLTFIRKHGDLDDNDIQMVSVYQRAIHAMHEAVKDSPVPLAGDIVEGAYYDGAFPFENGIIESAPGWHKDHSICATPFTPFIHLRNSAVPEIGLSVSGGPFFSIDAKDLEYIGEGERCFCDWGHCGPSADGAVTFPAKVNRWRVKESAKI